MEKQLKPVISGKRPVISREEIYNDHPDVDHGDPAEEIRHQIRERSHRYSTVDEW